MASRSSGFRLTFAADFNSKAMSHLPLAIPLFFGATTFLTIILFCRAMPDSRSTAITLLSWLVLQAVIGLTGFYTNTSAMPPRFALLIGPPLLFIAGLFLFPKGRRYLDRLDPKLLTLLHVIRIPVELILFWLCTHKTVPELMTFEGRNFDLLSGITAPIVWYFGFVRKRFSRAVLLIWNFFCLGLLINIVLWAVLSAPSPFQQLAFDQPNVAILHFPFIWLPCLIVPLVLVSHLAVIRKLLRSPAGN
jgi:hypothetical protein